MLVAFPVWTKKRNNHTRAQAHTDHNVATPFQQIQPNDTAGMQRDGVKADQRMAESEYRGGGKPIHIHQRGTFWLTPTEHINSYKRPKPASVTFAARVDLLFGSVKVLAWLAVTKSNSWIHNLFLIISPHGSAAFPPALNWNNLPACGRPQRILSLSPHSLFTAVFAYHPGKNECTICFSRQYWTIPNLGRVLIRKDQFWPNKKVLSSTRDSTECHKKL